MSTAPAPGPRPAPDRALVVAGWVVVVLAVVSLLPGAYFTWRFVTGADGEMSGLNLLFAVPTGVAAGVLLVLALVALRLARSGAQGAGAVVAIVAALTLPVAPSILSALAPGGPVGVLAGLSPLVSLVAAGVGVRSWLTERRGRRAARGGGVDSAA